MSCLWDECLWELILHHLIYWVCNAPLTWSTMFWFSGLGHFKIWDSRFILEFWDSILKIVWNCLRLRRDCMQFTLTHLCSQKFNKIEFLYNNKKLIFFNWINSKNESTKENLNRIFNFFSIIWFWTLIPIHESWSYTALIAHFWTST